MQYARANYYKCIIEINIKIFILLLLGKMHIHEAAGETFQMLLTQVVFRALYKIYFFSAFRIFTDPWLIWQSYNVLLPRKVVFIP